MFGMERCRPRFIEVLQNNFQIFSKTEISCIIQHIEYANNREMSNSQCCLQ